MFVWLAQFTRIHPGWAVRERIDSWQIISYKQWPGSRTNKMAVNLHMRKHEEFLMSLAPCRHCPKSAFWQHQLWTMTSGWTAFTRCSITYEKEWRVRLFGASCRHCLKSSFWQHQLWTMTSGWTAFTRCSITYKKEWRVRLFGPHVLTTSTTAFTRCSITYEEARETPRLFIAPAANVSIA